MTLYKHIPRREKWEHVALVFVEEANGNSMWQRAYSVCISARIVWYNIWDMVNERLCLLYIVDKNDIQFIPTLELYLKSVNH